MGIGGGKVGGRVWQGQAARFVSHLEVGQEESLWGAVVFVLPSRVLYKGRTVAFAEPLPLLLRTADLAVDRLVMLLLLLLLRFGGIDEAVEVLSWSINIPTLRGRNKVEPCRNNCQTRLD